MQFTVLRNIVIWQYCTLSNLTVNCEHDCKSTLYNTIAKQLNKEEAANMSDKQNYWTVYAYKKQ